MSLSFALCRRVFLIVLAAISGTLPAHGDWLVQNDGTRIETRGRWRIQGDWLFYTDTAGEFRAMLVREIDLEESQIASRQGGGASDATSGDTSRKPSSAESTRPARPAAATSAPSARVPPPTEPASPVVQARNITLYTTSWCPYCRQARQLLDSLGVAYIEKDIEKSAAARSELTAKAGRNSGVPVLDVDGRLVRGYNRDRIRELVGGSGSNSSKRKT